MTRHVVMFSGGIGSWAAAKRVVERHGATDVTLLFTDTMMEDEDLYRFLEEAAADVFRNMPPNLVRIAEGRDPWQVFFDKRFLGNSRIDPCSEILKRKEADVWLKENCDPNDTVIYLGIDWSERHRFDDGVAGGAKNRYARKGWMCEAPMCEAPFLSKEEMLKNLEAAGIVRPRLYVWGFPHNNCGGFCIKAGVSHFVHLLRTIPDRYAYHEQREQDLRDFLGKDVSILTEVVNGVKRQLTLQELRIRVQAGNQIEMFEWGGCGCFLGEEATAFD